MTKTTEETTRRQIPQINMIFNQLGNCFEFISQNDNKKHSCAVTKVTTYKISILS